MIKIDSNRFVAIDGLRGLAIFMVTALHLWAHAGQPYWHIGGLDLTPVMYFGRFGVPLFFCLSGFCLYYPIVRHGVYAPNWRNFFWRRTLRIWPAHLLALIVWLPIWAAPLHWEGWLKQTLAHLTFTYTLSLDTFRSFTPPLWSLGTEVHFYLAFPLLACCMYRRPWVTYAAMIAISLGVQLWSCLNGYELLTNWPQGILYCKSLPGRLMEFGAGMIVAHLVYSHRSPRKVWIFAAWAVGLFGLFVCPYIRAYFQSFTTYTYLWSDVLYSICFGALTYAAVVTPKSLLTHAISCRPMVWLGIVSYSIYLYNNISTVITPLVAPSAAPNSPVWWLVSAGSILVVGSISYYICEVPFLALRERLRREAIRHKIENPAILRTSPTD